MDAESVEKSAYEEKIHKILIYFTEKMCYYK